MRAAVLVALATLGLSVPGWAESPTPPPASGTKASLADLGWLAGRWVGDAEGDLSEEVWTEPAGDCMMGMWRWVSSGKAKLFEFLAITEGPDGIVIRLRHFDREMTGWEKEKERPLTLPLVRQEDGAAVFEGPEAGGSMVRLTYRRTGPDTLSVLLEKETQGKGPMAESFRFRRKAL